jgi:hypothetical protein
VKLSLCGAGIRQYAYILVAMQGESFCTSAVAAVGIIASNVKQVSVLAVPRAHIDVLWNEWE